MIEFHLDFETTSAVDLTKVGAERYAQDDSTVVLCMSYALGTGPVRAIIMPTARDVLRLLRTYDWQLHAWNANFEMAILRHKFGIEVDADRFSCTMQRSLHGGLPGSLKMAGRALKIQMQKGDDKIMRLMMRPKKDGSWWHEDPVEGPAKLAELAAYCDQDVEAERAIAQYIPELPAFEEMVSRLDHCINMRGLAVDLNLVSLLEDIAGEETIRLNARCAEITGSITSPGTQRARLMNWLDGRGVHLPDLGEETVSETLETAVDAGLPEDVIEVLGIRGKAAKASPAKLAAMKRMVMADGRVRGTLQYYGASRTGRFAGRLLQIQNMPKPTIRYVGAAIAMIRDGLDADGCRLIHGDPLEVVASCLRGCIVPGYGNRFVVFDFAQIEARIAAWLAGQQDAVDLFADNSLDVYTETANRFGLNSRNAGKVVVLGLGFGAGAERFVGMAKAYGVVMTLEESQQIVGDWRQANRMIVDMWHTLDREIRDLIHRHRQATAWMKSSIMVWPSSQRQFATVGRLTLRVSDARNGEPLLTIKLPSGRFLYYRNVRIELDAETGNDAITYDGSVNGAWLPVRSWGAKFFENIVQAIARDILVEAELRLDSGKTTEGVVSSIHDEIIMEVEEQYARDWFDAIATEIEVVPAWAAGLPIKATGKIMTRYAKA